MAFFSRSPLAFDDCQDLFERALNSKKGIKITCQSHGEAMALRMRLHYYRRKDKEANASIYPREHEMHKASVWDRLVCRVDDNVLRIEHRGTDHLIIEPIDPSDLEEPNAEDPPTS